MTPSSNKRGPPARRSDLEKQNEALRRAQIAAEQSRDRYRDLYEFAPVGYLTLTPEGLLDQLNLTAARLLGRTRQALLGKRLALLVADYDQDRWERFWVAVKESETQDAVELDLTRGDGKRFLRPARLPARDRSFGR